MTELVANILASAAVSMYKEQPTLSKFTSETSEYEPNLSFHYATNLRRFLFWLDCDFDVIKPNLESKRPDIIFHRRGIQALNFLVIEVKRHESGANDDIEKIKNNWFPGPLRYRFGASVVLDGKSFSVRLFERDTDKETTLRSDKDFNELSIPKASKRGLALASLSDRIFGIEKRDACADRRALERQMDELMCAFYSVKRGRHQNP